MWLKCIKYLIECIKISDHYEKCNQCTSKYVDVGINASDQEK